MNIKRDGFCSQNFNRFFCRCQVHVKEMCSGMSFKLRSFEACEELFSFIFPLSGEILDARQQRTQRREELASRGSRASLERMRILS